jgi:hypothetical protein
MNRNDVNRKTWYLLILMPIIYLAVSVLVVFLVKNNGAYPTGSDTMYHIFLHLICINVTGYIPLLVIFSRNGIIAFCFHRLFLVS